MSELGRAETNTDIIYTLTEENGLYTITQDGEVVYQTREKFQAWDKYEKLIDYLRKDNNLNVTIQ